MTTAREPTVVHILPSIDLVGGTARRVHDHIAASSLEQHIVLHDCWIDREREVRLARESPHVLTPVCFGFRDWVRALSSVLRLGRPLVLVSYFAKGHAVAQAMASAFPGCRHVVSLPGLDALGSVARRRLFALVLSRADVVFANSERTRRHYQVLCPSRRIDTIYNPVSRVERSARLDRQLEPAAGISLLGCGGLAPVKEYDKVLELCAYWSREGVPYECLIAGDGPQRPELTRYVAEHGLTRVSLPGYRDLPSLLTPGRTFIHPCSKEGFGLAPVEAALSGVPVVLSHEAGAAEVLRGLDHVLCVDFRQSPERLSGPILEFARSSRADEEQLRAIRERLSPASYAAAVDGAIRQCVVRRR